LEAISFSMAGEFRVTTDARVIDHNATGVIEAEKGALTYIWVMRGMVETAPLLIIVKPPLRPGDNLVPSRAPHHPPPNN
jgi:hypothetical protein